MRTLLIILVILVYIWQVFEWIHYGDDARINIFTTGDYKLIFKR